MGTALGSSVAVVGRILAGLFGRAPRRLMIRMSIMIRMDFVACGMFEWIEYWIDSFHQEYVGDENNP